MPSLSAGTNGAKSLLVLMLGAELWGPGELGRGFVWRRRFSQGKAVVADSIAKERRGRRRVERALVPWYRLNTISALLGGDILRIEH